MLQTQRLFSQQSLAESKAVLCLSKQKLIENIHTVKVAGNDNTKLLAVLKANAYGIGVDTFLEFLNETEIDFVGVVTVDEALELRKEGVEHPILLMMEPEIKALALILKHDISICLYSKDFLKELCAFPKEDLLNLKVHLKIDLGMSRLGLEKASLRTYLGIAQELGLKIEGVCSHFSSIHSDYEFSKLQLAEFDQIKNEVLELTHNSGIMFHIANTKAAHFLPNSRLDMVRVGFGLYNSAISLSSKIHLVKEIPSGSTVGYDRSYLLNEDAQIAVVAFGYADGMPYQLGNQGMVAIKNKLYPIVGKICMDWFMVNLGSNPDAIAKDDRVDIFRPDLESLKLENVAALIGVDPRMILCHLGKRVSRKVID